MSLLSALRSYFGPSPENPANPLRAPWFYWGGGQTSSGAPVSEESSLRMVTVYAAVRIIAETVGSLPLFVYRREDRGRALLREHPVTRLLHDAPNDLMTASSFRETLLASTLLWGNGFAAIIRDQAGRITELWPMRSDRVCIKKHGMSLRYTYTPDDGALITFTPSEVLHVPGLSFDGVRGLSPIQLAREAVGLGIACETFGSRFFGSGTHPSGAVQVPEKLSQGARQMLKEQVQRDHAGLGNSMKVLLLEEGASWQSMGVPPEDAQFLETRRYQSSEIATLYRIPHHMLGGPAPTWSNREQGAIEFVTMTLRAWMVRLEQEYNRKLLTQTTLYTEHVAEALLRGDIAARYKAYAVGRQWGWLSVDDVRELENMNPIPEGGDVYISPMNMTDASKVEPMAEAELELLEADVDNAEDGGRMPMMMGAGLNGTQVPDPDDPAEEDEL